MSDLGQLFPMLEGYILGDPISEHHGVCCYPAMTKDTDEKYIVKIISIPANPTQAEALLLTGAYGSEEDVLSYFKEIADGIMQEVRILRSLSEQEGFVPYTASAMVQNKEGCGFTVCLISNYAATPAKQLSRATLTHCDALNLGIDICSALSVCRRSGYLYVDLQPGNIYMSEDGVCRIGDLGFVPIDSLGYASLAEKYKSAYTPPEIHDAFSALNTTMDVYALGVILYQAYNNGYLPFNSAAKPGDPLLPPANADEEISRIILKACAVDPADRWQDPMEMGQALITYMQSNGASNTPITPVKTSSSRDNTTFQLTEDAEGHLRFSTDLEQLEADLQSTAEYNTISQEVSAILDYAETLAETPVPESVNIPEHVEIPVLATEIADTLTEQKDTEAVEADPDNSEPVENFPAETEASVIDTESDAQVKRSYCGMWRIAASIVIVLALLTGAIFFYNHYYLLTVDSIVLSGNGDTLTVTVTGEATNSKLYAVCLDIYGNQLSAEVVNGEAVFNNLIPNTAYTIQLSVDGLHRLTGDTKARYTSPPRSTITQFEAITGITDGSVFLSFAVEGPDSKQWTVEYWTDGEEIRTKTFNSHIVPINGLTVGKTYTFRLYSGKEIFITGMTEITYTAMKMVQAENLEVISCMDNTLTVTWSVPEGVTVDLWGVICSSNNSNYSETIVTEDTSATFYPLDHTESYRIEVKALGMSVSQMVTIPQNTVTLTNLQIDTTDPGRILLNWDTSVPVPESGWKLYYTVAGVDAAKSMICTENSAQIGDLIPNASYHIWLEDSNGNLILGSRMQIMTA